MIQTLEFVDGYIIWLFSNGVSQYTPYGIYSVRESLGGREGEQRSRQLCTSRLASGLHLYPHTSYRKEGEPRGPMRQYVPIIFHLVLFHSLAILSFPPSSSIVDYLVRHRVPFSRVCILHLSCAF